MKTVRSVDYSQRLGHCFLHRDAAVEFVKCHVSVLLAPQITFTSLPLYWGGGQRFNDRNLKTSENKTKTICMVKPLGVTEKKMPFMCFRLNWPFKSLLHVREDTIIWLSILMVPLPQTGLFCLVGLGS